LHGEAMTTRPQILGLWNDRWATRCLVSAPSRYFDPDADEILGHRDERMRIAGSLTLALLAVLACNDREPTKAMSWTGFVADGSADAETAPEAKNAISGSAEGRPFQTVMASWFIESPEVEGATFLYLFSTAVPCSTLSFSGWDRMVGDETAILAVEIFGTEPGVYSELSGPGPSPRTAAGVWSRASRRGGADWPASGGWVVLDALVQRRAARGTFSVTFGMRRVTGEFNAAFCQAGHEP
jgi:hypothetical protein